MRKAIAALLAVLLLTSAVVIGCSITLKSSGNLKTVHYPLDKFNQVEISSAFDFEITESDAYSIQITADDNLFNHIRVSKDGDTLKIDSRTLSIIGPVTLKAVITMPQLKSLDASGATHGTVSGFSSPNDARIVVSGASRVALSQMSVGGASLEVSGASGIAGSLAAKSMNLKVSGASEVELDGSASDIVVEASGASRAKLSSLKVSNASVNLSGASTGTVNLSGRLDAEITGASRLEYTGAPTMGNIETSGASTLSKK
jgi:hypothetical protein